MANWYSRETSAGQALICCEADGRSVAVAYDPKDGPTIAEAPAMLAALQLLANASDEDLPTLELQTAAIDARAILARIEGSN